LRKRVWMGQMGTASPITVYQLPLAKLCCRVEVAPSISIS